MAKRVYFLDGKFKKKPLSNIEDRGFFFSDSVYEVIRARNEKPFFLDEHLSRLERGLKELKINYQFDREYLEEIIKKSLRILKKKEAAIYLQITRGKEPRSHLPRKNTKPALIIITSEFRPLASRLFKEGVSVILYPDIRWARCDIKTTMLLPNVLAKIEAKERGFFDALFYKNGYITESTSSSFFGILGGKLITYPATNEILPSITREKVIDIARKHQIPVEERPILLQEIQKLEGAFLAGTTYDILPINRIENTKIPLSSLTSLIQEEYAKLLSELSL